MRTPHHVFEDDDVVTYLKHRDIVKQYKKAKQYFLDGRTGGLDLKERKPKGSGVWSFRINRQFRAVGYFDADNDFIVTMIDNHQR